MENLSLRPKVILAILQNQQLYILAEHWKSDLEFYKDDLRFLHHLIDEYFVWFAHREHLNEMRNLAGRLSKLVKNVIGY
jgi:hypothetical protein